MALLKSVCQYSVVVVVPYGYMMVAYIIGSIACSETPAPVQNPPDSIPQACTHFSCFVFHTARNYITIDSKCLAIIKNN